MKNAEVAWHNANVTDFQAIFFELVLIKSVFKFAKFHTGRRRAAPALSYNFRTADSHFFLYFIYLETSAASESASKLQISNTIINILS